MSYINGKEILFSPTVNVEIVGGGGGEIDALIERTLTEISSGVMSIGSSAFREYSTLTSANFPNATSIGASAFYTCRALASVNFPKATSIGGYAFNACSNLASAYFPNAESIKNNAFDSCSALASIDFPNATSIGGYAFKKCSALTMAHFPNVTETGSYSFNECKALESAEFPKAQTVAQYMFFGCFLLESVDISNATKIETYAFSACRSLKSVILRSETVCTLATIQAFNNCCHILGTVDSTYNPNGDKDGYIYVPSHLVESYKTATNWSTYASQIRAIDGGGEAEGNWLFQNEQITDSGNTELPSLTAGVSYTAFVNGEEIATQTADEEGCADFCTEDYRVYLRAEPYQGWHFHPVESEVTSGSVSIRINE